MILQGMNPSRTIHNHAGKLGAGSDPIAFLHQKNTRTLPSLLPLPSDLIRFSGRETDKQIAQRFKKEFEIDVDQIREVRSLFPEAQPIADKLKPKDIRKIAIEALRAYTQAWKNSKLTNFSNHYWGYSMQLQTGHWELATNIEHARDCAYCGERAAFDRLWNNKIEQVPVEKFKDKRSLEHLRKTLQVKTIVMADAETEIPYYSSVKAGKMSPCSECLDTINAGRYYSPETQMMMLCRDPSSGEFYLGFRQMKDFLPVMGKQQVSLSDKPIESLPLQFSERAKTFLNKKGKGKSNQRDTSWWESQIKNHLKAAQAEYRKPGEPPKGTLKNIKHLDSKQVYVATLFNRGDYSQVATRVENSKRWNTPAEICAEIMAVHQFSNLKNQGELEVNLMAYYGDDPVRIPNLKSLGPIAALRGNPETLLAMIENGTIHVRTIRDYMPYLYL